MASVQYTGCKFVNNMAAQVCEPKTKSWYGHGTPPSKILTQQTGVFRHQARSSASGAAVAYKITEDLKWVVAWRNFAGYKKVYTDFITDGDPDWNEIQGELKNGTVTSEAQSQGYMSKVMITTDNPTPTVVAVIEELCT